MASPTPTPTSSTPSTSQPTTTTTTTTPEIPKKQKAIVYDNPGTISTKIVELDVPEPGPGEVLVNLTHSGVCHSDMGVMCNSWTMLPYPTLKNQVGGHEGVGTIVKLGPDIDASTSTSAGVKVGDRVGIKWLAGVCANCEACRAGMDAMCAGAKISGYYHPGTFQQYALSPANYVTPIPASLSSAQAAPLLCAGVTVYAALRKSGAQAGAWVVVSGAGGGLGHLAVQFAARAIGLRVIGVDHSSKRGLVLSSGAEAFVAIDGEADVVAAVKDVTGGSGAQAVLVMTASNAAYGSGLSMLKFGGRLVCVGVPEGKPVAIAGAFPHELVARGLQIVGSAVGDRREAIEALEFAARGVVETRVRVEGMEGLTRVFEEMEKGELMGRVVLDLS